MLYDECVYEPRKTVFCTTNDFWNPGPILFHIQFASPATGKDTFTCTSGRIAA